MDEKSLLAAIEKMFNEKFEVVEQRLTKVEVTLENNTQKILNLLQEDYGRVATATAKVSDYDEVKSAVSDHQKALENHNKRITKLEKKAI